MAWSRTNRPVAAPGSPPRSAAVARALAATWALAVFLLLLSGAGAQAVLLDGSEGLRNASAPTPDPGFARVGARGALSGVYVRNGWVLTASHVGAGPITLGGKVYSPLAGSTVSFADPDGSHADLIAFKLATRPPLADIEIADQPIARDTLVTLIGNGRDRGAATTWLGIDGWTWSSYRTLRWGSNRVSAVDEVVLSTRAFRTTFDAPLTAAAEPDESDVVTGDSGGGVFTGAGASARLVGILFARSTYVGQPASTSLHGNAGLSVDLYAYRDAIVATLDQPDCDDGLDEDGDGLVDFPNDPGCASANDGDERGPGLVCDDGLDQDGDGLLDHPADPGCASAFDGSERGAPQQCDNGLDDDDDGAADFPADSGCLHPTNRVEAPEPGLGPLLAAGSLALAAHGRARRVRATQTSSTRSTR